MASYLQIINGLKPRQLQRSASFDFGHRGKIPTQRGRTTENISHQRQRSHSIDHGNKTSNVHPRIKTDYFQNVSAALQLPLSTDELKEKKNNPAELVSLSENFIREHAARRVDLFFYIMIAYYRTGLNPIKGHTVLQHGRGRNDDNGDSITQGCHSSFFGEFIDGVDNRSTQLSHTHFLNSLNATIELPFVVNKFDDVLEESYFGRQKSLAILHRVSRGEIDPVQGLGLFLQMMAKMFQDIEDNKKVPGVVIPYLSRDSFHLPMSVKEQIIKFEKLGTLTNKWNPETQTVNQAYVEMLLRLKPDEIKRCEEGKAQRQFIYETKFKKIQQEILTPIHPPEISVKSKL